MIKSVMAGMIKELILEQDRRKATNKRPMYQSPVASIPKECFKLHIRARYYPHSQTMQYSFGYREVIIGRSWVDENGVFQKSDTLKVFITRYNLLP